jgi:hypothetical protein
MEENQPPQPPSAAQPRRFVYRSVEPETNPHPMRRRTDIPHPFRGIPGQASTGPQMLRMRVYLKLN